MSQGRQFGPKADPPDSLGEKMSQILAKDLGGVIVVLVGVLDSKGTRTLSDFLIWNAGCLQVWLGLTESLASASALLLCKLK